ncbi:dihydropyrimidinase [Aphelenchoides avenae]|nr:dihydropyrimidinase [Aphelenchus avenae]
MSLLIVNGLVVNDDALFKADVLVEDGKITAISENYPRDGVERVIDATGRYVIPGGIDPQTHFQMPYKDKVSVDDFYHGTRAALAGGTTTVSTGVNSFKFYFSFDDVMVRDEAFYAGAKYCARIGALARVHAENGPVIKELQHEVLSQGITGPEGHWLARPEELEAECVKRACVLAAQAKCPLYIDNVTSKNVAKDISSSRRHRHIVFGETTAAGLALSAEHSLEDDLKFLAAYVTSPPVRKDPKTPSVLMDALSSGDLQLVSSNNMTFSCDQKYQQAKDFTEIVPGVNGVEDRMSIVWQKGVQQGNIDPRRFVAITSTEAAKIFNLYPRKGRIQVGSDADIVIWNPSGMKTISAKTHHHAGDFNVFEGMEVHGAAEVTVAGGQVVWENGELSAEAGTGQFVPMKPWCDYVYSGTKLKNMLCPNGHGSTEKRRYTS